MPPFSVFKELNNERGARYRIFELFSIARFSVDIHVVGHPVEALLQKSVTFCIRQKQIFSVF
jgi:hypothetical protein